MAKGRVEIDAPKLAVGLLILGAGAWLLSKLQGGAVDYCRLAGGPRTISDGAVAVIVSRVRGALYTGLFWEDEEEVIDALLECGSDADVYAVACSFGQWAPVLQTDRDLFQALRAFLSADDLDALNAGWRERGISLTA